jgi:hypothetical protein
MQAKCYATAALLIGLADNEYDSVNEDTHGLLYWIIDQVMPLIRFRRATGESAALLTGQCLVGEMSSCWRLSKSFSDALTQLAPTWTAASELPILFQSMTMSCLVHHMLHLVLFFTLSNMNC